MLKTLYRALVVASIALVSAIAQRADAQPVLDDVNFSQLPTCNAAAEGRTFWVKDNSSASGNCAAGGGSKAICTCDGSNWVVQSGSGGSGSNSFETINMPSGTDPVADSGTDTLNVTCTAPMVCTGTAGTDTADWSIISGTVSRCARFDGSGALVVAAGDCASGDTVDGSSMILDLDDDESNESTNLQEIAVIGDNGDAFTESSNDKLLIDMAKIPPFRQYHPDRPPSSCATCDEFTGDAATLTFTSAGNADVTQSYALDAMRLKVTGDSTAIDKYIITTAAPSGSWVASTKVTVDFLDSGAPTCGLIAITAGTQASPTGLTFASIFLGGGSTQDFTVRSATSLTSAVTTYGVPELIAEEMGAWVHYLQLRYDAAADTITGCVSESGWPALAQCETQTSVTSDPPYIGFLIDDLASVAGGLVGECFFHFLRVRTDGTGTADPYPIGE